MGAISRQRRQSLTDYSLKILEHPDIRSKDPTMDDFKPGALLQDLKPYARMCGPYAAAAWARNRGLDIHYVDNCWLYVTVGRSDLEDFMLDILGGTVAPDARVLPGRRYLLMAEEY
jgi:hypothetical protein